VLCFALSCLSASIAKATFFYQHKSKSLVEHHSIKVVLVMFSSVKAASIGSLSLQLSVIAC